MTYPPPRTRAGAGLPVAAPAEHVLVFFRQMPHPGDSDRFFWVCSCKPGKRSPLFGNAIDAAMSWTNHAASKGECPHPSKRLVETTSPTDLAGGVRRFHCTRCRGWIAKPRDVDQQVSDQVD